MTTHVTGDQRAASSISTEPHPEAHRFITEGRLNRPIPEAIQALRKLLEGFTAGMITAEIRSQIAEIATELEVYGTGILARTVPQHEVDAIQTHVSIEGALSDAYAVLDATESSEDGIALYYRTLRERIIGEGLMFSQMKIVTAGTLAFVEMERRPEGMTSEQLSELAFAKYKELLAEES